MGFHLERDNRHESALATEAADSFIHDILVDTKDVLKGALNYMWDVLQKVSEADMHRKRTE